MSDSPYQGRYRETERRGFGEDSHGGDVYREDAGQVIEPGTSIVTLPCLAFTSAGDSA